MIELVDRLRMEEGRRAVRLGNSLSMRYAHREDVRALLREAADALEVALEDAWQPIETAPKDGTEVLLLFPCGSVIGGWWYSGPYVEKWSVISLNSHGCGCCAEDNEDPTHWMPLPAPPKEARNG